MANEDYKENGRIAQFAPLSELAEPVEYLDRVIPLGRANFPRIDSLKVGMPALCDEEFMQVTAIAPGRISVKRGTADTVPARHAKETLIWFLDPIQGIGGDLVEHSAGETTSVKYAPFTIGGGKLPLELSEIDGITFNWRQYRPYPPGQMRVRGDRWWVEHTISADDPYLTLSWVHRDRTLQADQLVDHDEPNIGPEPGTTYTVRIYNKAGDLMRTEVGILADPRDIYGNLVAPSWTYTWQQAMADLKIQAALEKGTVEPGTMTIFSTRDGFDSWQGYTIPFKVNSLGIYMKVAQAAQLVGQYDDIEKTGGPYPPASGVYGAQAAQMVAQPLDDALNAVPAADALYVANVHESAGQQTSLPASLNRNLFEAPYALLRRRGENASSVKLVTVAARPSDRLTDTHSVWTRYDYPLGTGASLEYARKVDPDFTPWITLGKSLDYLDTNASIAASSFFDGIPLDGVQPGQVALVDAEIVRIEGRTADSFIIARGVFDTVPTKHQAGSRVWFFEAAAGNDPTEYPLTKSANNVLGAAMQVKMVPGVYGPPVDLELIPTDRVDTARRVARPYAPGEVLVNGQPWFLGAQLADVGGVARITWNHRNRDTQGAQAVDHHAGTRAPEDGQKYRLTIKLSLYDVASKTSYTSTIRSDVVDGSSYDYTYAMAAADGYRAGTLLKACGRVTVGIVLEAIRDDLVSWQNYTIPLLLPSYACPAGQAPGGGQLPPQTGGGNGTTQPSPNPPPPPSPGGDNTGGSDPYDPGPGGDGSGPPPPPDLPPDWPSPVDPQPEPDPEDPNPQLAGHWDTNWDRHWDAYNKDNQGN